MDRKTVNWIDSLEFSNDEKNYVVIEHGKEVNRHLGASYFHFILKCITEKIIRHSQKKAIIYNRAVFYNSDFLRIFKDHFKNKHKKTLRNSDLSHCLNVLTERRLINSFIKKSSPAVYILAPKHKLFNDYPFKRYNLLYEKGYSLTIEENNEYKGIKLSTLDNEEVVSSNIPKKIKSRNKNEELKVIINDYIEEIFHMGKKKKTNMIFFLAHNFGKIYNYEIKPVLKGDGKKFGYKRQDFIDFSIKCIKEYFASQEYEAFVKQNSGLIFPQKFQEEIEKETIRNPEHGLPYEIEYCLISEMKRNTEAIKRELLVEKEMEKV